MIVTNVNSQVPIGEFAKFKKQTIQKAIHKYTPTLDKANTVMFAVLCYAMATSLKLTPIMPHVCLGIDH